MLSRTHPEALAPAGLSDSRVLRVSLDSKGGLPGVETVALVVRVAAALALGLGRVVDHGLVAPGVEAVALVMRVAAALAFSLGRHICCVLLGLVVGKV